MRKYFNIFPLNVFFSFIVGTMLAHRLRCWPNIVPTLDVCRENDQIHYLSIFKTHQRAKAKAKRFKLV